MFDVSTLREIFAPIMSWFLWVLIAYFVAIVTDYLTGTIAAYLNGEWVSSKARKGLIKKCLMLAVLMIPLLLDVLIGLAADKVITLPWTFRGLFLPLATVWYMITELGSIIENLDKLGVPIPAFLKRAISAIHKSVDKAGEDIVPESVEDDKEEVSLVEPITRAAGEKYEPPDEEDWE